MPTTLGTILAALSRLTGQGNKIRFVDDRPCFYFLEHLFVYLSERDSTIDCYAQKDEIDIFHERLDGTMSAEAIAEQIYWRCHAYVKSISFHSIDPYNLHIFRSERLATEAWFASLYGVAPDRCVVIVDSASSAESAYNLGKAWVDQFKLGQTQRCLSTPLHSR